MRRLITMLAACLAAFALAGVEALAADQIEKGADTTHTRSIDAVFDSFYGAKGFTTVVYGEKMLSMMREQTDDKALAELIGSLSTIRIMVSRGDDAKVLAFTSKLATIGDSYKLISAVSDDGKTTKFYFKQEPWGKSSFLMISKDRGKTAVLDIYGDFDVKDVSKLSSLGK